MLTKKQQGQRQRTINEQNMFDLTRIDDLPKELIKIIKKPMKGYANTYKSQILEFFEIKNKLAIKEIIAAYYRKYALILKGKNVSCIMYYLEKTNMVKKISVGVYELIKKDNL